MSKTSYCYNPDCKEFRISDFHSVVAVTAGCMGAIAFSVYRAWLESFSIEKLQSLAFNPGSIFAILIIFLLSWGGAKILTQYERFHHPVLALIYGAAVPNLFWDLIAAGLVRH